MKTYLIQMGRNLRAAREAAGITKEKMVADAQLGINTPFQIESGLINPRMTTMIRMSQVIATATGENVNDVLCRIIPSEPIPNE